MHDAAARAYGQTTRATAHPRELEAHLLMKSAKQLQTIQDNWDDLKGTLNDALFYNRRLWSVFIDAVTAEDSPLPRPIAQNIANLGLFVFNHTLKIQTQKQPHLLTALISINREIAAGLRGDDGRDAAPAPTPRPATQGAA